MLSNSRTVDFPLVSWQNRTGCKYGDIDGSKGWRRGGRDVWGCWGVEREWDVGLWCRELESV